MAMAASLEEGPIGDGVVSASDGQEFNAYTLFGADQPIYLTFLRMVEAAEGGTDLSDEVLLDRLRAHIDRGVQHLSARVKVPSDVARLFAGKAMA